LPNPVWLTRDRLCGALADEVEVWSRMPPSRYRMDDGDVVWLAEPLDERYPRVRSADLLGTWTLREACSLAGFAVPGSDVECVRFPPRRPDARVGVQFEALS
jgi:hypothetical protein